MMGKLLCFLRLHKLTLISYGFNSTVNARCERCAKHVVISIWGTRP
jgi:hypothetical protein